MAFKVGDKVRVKEDVLGGGGDGPDIEAGEVFTFLYEDENGICFTNEWWFHEDELELVEE